MGRPRKYPIIVVENKDSENTQKVTDGSSLVSEPKVKKKRGRKPKIRTPEELELLAQVGKKKRGRKPKEKFNFNSKNTHSDNNDNENQSIIVRLSISPDDIKNLENNNKQPKPFDPNDNLQYNSNILGYSTIKKNNNNKLEIKLISSDTILDVNNNKTTTTTTDKNNNLDKNINENSDNINYDLKNEKILNIKTNNIIKNEINTNLFNNSFMKTSLNNEKLDNRQISLLLKNKDCKENKINVLMQLSHCNKIKKWPEKTNICCLWCCHEFENTPWGIPYKYEEDLFHLFGIFCSPNCSASYIFNNLYSTNKKWEYFSLLNLLYYKIYNEMKNIYLAPSKLSLKKFGGCLDIDEYRDKFNKDNIYLLKFPPSVSIIPVIEEIDENKYNIKNMNKSNNFIPLDANRIKKANKELKLKRSKPLTNSKNTLDSCMNISIIS